MPSSIPFEQRYVPPDPKRRKREKLTRVDRFVCAVMGGVLGFAIWSFGYIIMLMVLMKAAGKAAARQPVARVVVDPFDMIPDFSWGGFVIASFSIFSAIVGPERMLDAFEKIIHVEGEVAKHANRS